MSFPPRSVPWMRNTVTRAVASPMKSRRANGRPNSSWGQVCRAGRRRRGRGRIVRLRVDGRPECLAAWENEISCQRELFVRKKEYMTCHPERT